MRFGIRIPLKSYHTVENWTNDKIETVHFRHVPSESPDRRCSDALVFEIGHREYFVVRAQRENDSALLIDIIRRSVRVVRISLRYQAHSPYLALDTTEDRRIGIYEVKVTNRLERIEDIVTLTVNCDHLEFDCWVELAPSRFGQILIKRNRQLIDHRSSTMFFFMDGKKDDEVRLTLVVKSIGKVIDLVVRRTYLQEHRFGRRILLQPLTVLNIAAHGRDHRTITRRRKVILSSTPIYQEPPSSSFGSYTCIWYNSSLVGCVFRLVATTF